MSAIIKCPKDKTPIGQVDRHGSLVATCSKCNIRYGAIYGKLTARGSKQITLQRQTSKQPGRYRRDYDLRIKRPSGGLFNLEFSDKGKEDALAAKRGDQVTIIWQVNAKDGVGRIIKVENNTTSQSTLFARPSGDYSGRVGVDPVIGNFLAGGAAGVSIVFGIIYLLAMLPDPSGALILVGLSIGLVLGGIAWFYLTRFLIRRDAKHTAKLASQKPREDPEKRHNEAQQGLLQTKLDLTERIAALVQERDEAQHKFDQLKSL